MMDFNKFPISYGEKTRELAEKSIFDHFEKCDDEDV